jgi:hypothetical protein
MRASRREAARVLRHQGRRKRERDRGARRIREK